VEPNVIEREMAVSHADFHRTLPAALGRRPVTGADGSVSLEDRGRKVTFELGPEEQRTLGNMVFPRTLIRIAFLGYEESDIRQFLERFDAYFRRGGG
jgi:hypothetical protein